MRTQAGERPDAGYTEDPGRGGVTIEKIRERDFIGSYATFFAVRSPGRSRAGHDCELAPLPDLFARYAKHAGEAPSAGPGSRTVFVPVAGDENARVEQPMQEFPCFHQGVPKN